MSIRRSTLLLLLASTAALAQPVPLPKTQPVADVVVNMRGVEIAAVAQQISRITGRTLILDPAVKGVVNVTSAEPLTPYGVWELFQSVLRVHGFATVRSGTAWRIIPQANAVREAGIAGNRISGQEVVTRTIRLRNVASEAAARAFKPMVANFGSIEALTNPNAIVVTDYADNVRRIERLATALDGNSGNYQVIHLDHGSARDVAAAIKGVLGDSVAGSATRIIADERSNVVVVKGEPHIIAQAQRLARTLDQPGGGSSVTRLFRLSNADAEAVTTVLRGILGQPAAASNPVARSLAAMPQQANSVGTGTAASDAGNATASGQLTASLPTRSETQAVQGFSTPELTIQPAPELNAIVARGTMAAIASIEPLIRDLDVRRPQVLIDAAIVEVNSDVAEAISLQLGLGAAALNQADGAATSFTTLAAPLRSLLGAIGAPGAIGVLPDGVSANVGITDNFSALIQALGQSTKANLLSTPSITTLDNEPAAIVVGQNVPFRTGSYTTDGNSLNPFTTIERQDVGITLRVLPRVHHGDVVRLEVAQEVSSLANANVIGAADLITNRRSIQTTVLADNGETIVLGGLITDDRSSARSQVPILGDIPVLGELFKGRKENRARRTLFVFLRPTILRDRNAVAQSTEERRAKLRDAEQGLSERDSLLLKPPINLQRADKPDGY